MTARRQSSWRARARRRRQRRAHCPQRLHPPARRHLRRRDRRRRCRRSRRRRPRRQVAFHLARRGDVPARQHRVARDWIGEVERAARAEVVRAELLRNGVVALVLEAAACDEQAQGEHAQGPCDRCHIGSPRLPSSCRPGTCGILQAIVGQSRASPRTRICPPTPLVPPYPRFSARVDAHKEKAATRSASRGFSDAGSSVTARYRPPVGPSLSSVARSPPACD